MPSRKKEWTQYFTTLRVILILVLLSGYNIGTIAMGAELFSAFSTGDYESTRKLLSDMGESASQDDFKLLNLLVTLDPGQADALLEGLAKGDKAEDPWQVRWALEASNEAYTRGDYELVLTILKPFEDAASAKLPGLVFVRAGLACRALNRMQSAREMLASVKPQDPSFALARYYLGDIALEQGDPELALHYFDAATGQGQGQGDSMSRAGKYEALLALGRKNEAEALWVDTDNRQRGLSWLAVAASPDFSTLPEDSVSTVPSPVHNSRFCLQWAAFSDRALALNFVQQHQEEISDLRIESDVPTGGASLFYVRSGSFNNPVEARAQADALGTALKMDVLVKDIK